MAKRPSQYLTMPFSELLQLREEIEKALNKRVATERETLQTRMAALSAIENGRSTAGTRGRRGRPAGGASARTHPLKGKKAAPKYRGPDGETWAGRGLAPRWLTALEKKGKKRESFLIAGKRAE
jgi:DNA-binding protein H-NS